MIIFYAFLFMFYVFFFHLCPPPGIKEHSCDVCNYSGVTPSDLTRHRKTQSHIGRTANICDLCGLGFNTPSQRQVTETQNGRFAFRWRYCDSLSHVSHGRVR